MKREGEKTALVTGASSGIGEALSKLLVTKGYRCVAIARRREKLKALQEQLGGEQKLVACPCDVSSMEEVFKVSKALREQNLMPNLFFLNAGMTGLPALDPKDHGLLQHHQDLFAANYFGVLNWVEAWRDHCLEHNSETVFLVTSSLNAIFAPPGGSAYAASKAAIAKAFEAFDLQYSSQGLRFLASFPGPVATPGFVGKLPFTWPPEKMAQSLFKQAIQGKARRDPSKFHSCLFRLLRHLPYKAVHRLLKTQ